MVSNSLGGTLLVIHLPLSPPLGEIYLPTAKPNGKSRAISKVMNRSLSVDIEFFFGNFLIEGKFMWFS
jgi:hypothetical protein